MLEILKYGDFTFGEPLENKFHRQLCFVKKSGYGRNRFSRKTSCLFALVHGNRPFLKKRNKKDERRFFTGRKGSCVNNSGILLCLGEITKHDVHLPTYFLMCGLNTTLFQNFHCLRAFSFRLPNKMSQYMGLYPFLLIFKQSR